MSSSINETVVNVLIVIVAALISGLLGVVISNRDYRKSEIKRAKLNVLQQLMANRFNIRREGFIEALNQAFVVFYDAKEVLSALDEFHEYTLSANRTDELGNQKLLRLFKAMCKDVRIETTLTDNFFLRPFTST